MDIFPVTSNSFTVYFYQFLWSLDYFVHSRSNLHTVVSIRGRVQKLDWVIVMNYEGPATKHFGSRQRVLR